MKRLTQWIDEKAYPEVITRTAKDGRAFNSVVSEGEICKKLALYEDIGGVDNFKNCVDALKRLLEHGLTPDEAVELSAAKAEGRLVVLPCKVGDILYWVSTFRGKKRIIEYKAQNFTFFDDGFYISCGTTLYFWDNEIGRKVYLTREEAEKALGEECDYV
jgi:hypothetical protein